MKLTKGMLFHNRYLLISQMGAGASGEVWKAKDTMANNLVVALKVFTNNGEIDTYGLQDFEREFTTVYNLKNSYLLPPTGYNVCDGNPYLVMQYCENGSASGMVGRAEEEDVIKMLHDVAAGLEYLHDHNVIHQDIKPDNILLDDNCNFLITDFGISVNNEGDNGIDNSNGMSGGTRAYMGPERFEGHTVAASDIWALGATAVEMLTGNPPYGDHGGLLQAEGEPLPALPAKLQPEVRDMILSTLDKDPEKRIKANEIRRKIDLYNETGKWERQTNKKLITIIACSVASVLLCVGIFLWDYNRTKVSYYKDYTEVWGVPQGIGRLSSSEAKKMHRMYQFEKRQGKVRTVKHVNSLGIVINDSESERSDRPLNQDITYNNDGKVSRIKVKDHNGKVLYVKSFNDRLNTISFQYDDEYNTERALAASTIGYNRVMEEENGQKSKITRWLINYDKDGHPVKVMFAGLDNSYVGDENNIYGRLQKFDDKGRVVEITYIGQDGEPKSTNWGLGKKVFVYDENDNYIRGEYYTTDGLPALDDPDGTYIFEMYYNDNNNVVKSLHRDGNGNLMITKNSGVAGRTVEYDDHGFITKEMYIGIDEQPAFALGTGYAGYTAECDENGFFNLVTYVDTNGNPCETLEGNSSRQMINDPHGNALENWTYNLTGNLVAESGTNYAGIVCQYDSIGNLVLVQYYDTDRNLVNNESGSAAQRFKYDDRNLISEIIYYDTDMMPAMDNNGVVIMKNEYDKRGNLIKRSFWNADESKLMKSHEGVAVAAYKYDDLGNELECEFFNENNEPTYLNEGWAKRVMTYDENGHPRSERYYDTKGNLKTTSSGVAGVNYKCDVSGNVLEKNFIGADGKSSSNFNDMRMKYDDNGNNIEEAYFSNGKPVKSKDGYHKIIAKYDSRNQCIEHACYDVNGNLTKNSQGFAVDLIEYNELGHKVKQKYLGTDRKPTKSEEGWASSTYEYDVFGNAVKQCFFDVNGAPCDPKDMVPVGIAKYDSHNNMIFLAAQDGYGNYIIYKPFGCAIQRAEYNPRSQLLWSCYYDEKEKPMLGNEGYHKVEYTYDSRGNRLTEAYFDKNLQPAQINGYHKTISKYNDNNMQTEWALYDKNGKPTNCDAGFHKIVVEYDESNVPTIRRYYQANNTLMASQSYDKNNRSWRDVQVSQSYIDNISSSANMSNSNSDWLSQVKDLAEQCPIDIEDGLQMKSISYTSSSITFNLKFTQLSSSDLADIDGNEMDQNIKEFRDFLRSEAGIPYSVSITINVYDKSDRLIKSF